MNTPWIDLAAPQAWALIGTAFVLLTLSPAWIRRVVFAGINLGLVTLLVGLPGLALVCTILFAVFVGCRIQSRSAPIRRLGAGLLLTGLIAVFVLHKQDPAWVTHSPLAAITRQCLAAVGYSYLCLRAIDLLRHVADGMAPAPSALGTVNYLIPFNMLTAGPIQTYGEFSTHQATTVATESSTERLERWVGGAERIATGMVKKFVVANAIHALFLVDFETTGWAFVLETNAFYLWLYFDFSAYSDIAVGVGQMCGIRTPENFNRPLSARNLTVFWERWHISLSLWVRRNLYIPVQLWLARSTQNRRPVLTSTVAFTVAFTVCGLWHDVSLRFLLWGFFHALGLSACNAYRHVLVKRHGRKAVRTGYMKRPVVRWVSTLITFEFVAASLAFAFYPSFG